MTYLDRLLAAERSPEIVALAVAEAVARSAYVAALAGPLDAWLIAEREYGVARYRRRAAIGRLAAGEA